MKYSLYFQATVVKELCWLVTSSLRFSEHIAFDRALNKEISLFEFFVAPGMEDVFLQIMGTLEKEGVVFNLVQLPNRLLTEPL